MSALYHKGDVMIRPAVHLDVDHMKTRIRESDRIEIDASSNDTPYTALSRGLRESTFCATVLYKGEPVAMFGVVPDAKVKKAGVVWLLATDGIYRMRWTFLKLTKRYIKLMMARYPLLFNFVDPRNTTTIRWLAWAGASLDDPKPYGINGSPFQQFCFEKEITHV